MILAHNTLSTSMPPPLPPSVCSHSCLASSPQGLLSGINTPVFKRGTFQCSFLMGNKSVSTGVDDTTGTPQGAHPFCRGHQGTGVFSFASITLIWSGWGTYSLSITSHQALPPEPPTPTRPPPHIQMLGKLKRNVSTHFTFRDVHCWMERRWKHPLHFSCLSENKPSRRLIIKSDKYEKILNLRNQSRFI